MSKSVRGLVSKRDAAWIVASAVIALFCSTIASFIAAGGVAQAAGKTVPVVKSISFFIGATDAYTVFSDEEFGLTVKCPADDQVVGGGVSFVTYNQVERPLVLASIPVQDGKGTAWKADVYNPSKAHIKFRISATCETVTYTSSASSGSLTPAPGASRHLQVVAVRQTRP
jgi:hypothetical protein